MVSNGDLDLASPTTCSSICPGCDTSALRASRMASMVIGEADLTTACRARDNCAYPMAQPVAMPTPVHIVVAESAATRTSSSVDITPSSRVLTAATIEPATLAALGSDLIMAPQMIRSAVCPEPVLDVPAVMLMQSKLDIADSSGSGAEMSMLAPIHKPEDADTAGMHENEQLMVCSSMEWPLAIVAARDVVDDHSFVNSCVTGTYDVLLPLKLLEFPLSKSKEPYVSPVLPQCTEDMVTWGTSLNQLHPKYTGGMEILGRRLVPF